MPPKQTKPAYRLSDLVSACAKTPEKVFVIKGAMVTADSDFQLKTQSAVIAFVGNGGLESPSWINTEPWENNPHPQWRSSRDVSVVIWVDAHNFFSGPDKYGYVSFLWSPMTEKWNIKSFKKNDKSDPRNLPFKNALKGFQFKKLENK